jgi:hypothetical protein
MFWDVSNAGFLRLNWGEFIEADSGAARVVKGSEMLGEPSRSRAGVSWWKFPCLKI